MASHADASQVLEEPPTSATSYRWESDLVSAIKANPKPWTRHSQQPCSSLDEVRVGTVLADLVYIWREERDVPLLPPSLTPQESLCLAWLRTRRSTRIDHLEKLCGIDYGELRNGALSRLHEAGLVERGCGGRIALTYDWSASVQIVSVEAKLHNWKKALSQARSNMTFADFSYVALPWKKASLISRLEQPFLKSGVGLLLVSAGRCDEVLPPRVSHGHTWRREYVFSRAVLNG